MRKTLGQSGNYLFKIATLATLFVLGCFAQQEQDPPARVARLNYVYGNASVQPAGVNEWGPAEVNQPLTTGDSLSTDVNSRLELHTDVAAIRAGSQTVFGFLNLDDQSVQMKVTEGDVSIRLHHFEPNQTFEVDTPNVAVTLLRDGEYRFRIGANGDMSFVVARSGSAEITGGGQAVTLNAGNSARIDGVGQLAFDVVGMPPPDDFDQWCATRDAREARSASARYLPPTVIGYEDLDAYGAWESAGDYGPVWYPRVEAGWVPYHAGHWAWVEPWGWTWIDAAPWGFAPFHYGRWAWIGNRWGWCPGPVAVVGYHGPVIRPYYAPALVAWFGGPHWSVSISTGAAAPSLGWVALGVGEVFTPAYHCSRPYFSNVNVYNTHVVKTVNITNVYESVYVRKTVYNQTFVNVRAPNAVVAMRQDQFASGRQVRQAAMVLRGQDLARMQPAAATVITPGVPPQRTAFMSQSAATRPIYHPPAAAIQRAVVVVKTPPPAPAPPAVRQAYLQQHAAEPHDSAAMHQQVSPAGTRPLAAVKVAPPATPAPLRRQEEAAPVQPKPAAPIPAARAAQGPPPQSERPRTQQQQNAQQPQRPAVAERQVTPPPHPVPQAKPPSPERAAVPERPALPLPHAAPEHHEYPAARHEEQPHPQPANEHKNAEHGNEHHSGEKEKTPKQ